MGRLVRALAVTLDAEDEALVDRLVPPGFPSTHGFTDPGHPLEGRSPRHAEGTVVRPGHAVA